MLYIWFCKCGVVNFDSSNHKHICEVCGREDIDPEEVKAESLEIARWLEQAEV